MISFIRGTLVGSDSESALIEVNGIGYRVAMSYHALSNLGSKGDEVLVLTYLYVREDALVLLWFVDEESEAAFEAIITKFQDRTEGCTLGALAFQSCGAHRCDRFARCCNSSEDSWRWQEDRFTNCLRIKGCSGAK